MVPWVSSVLFVLFLLLAPAASAATITGWRGDGTGRYPDADPPTTWGRVSRAVQGLRCRACKPARGQAPQPNDGDTSQPMPDGVIREWLILGPVPIPEGAKIEKDLLPDEAGLAPDEGDKQGDLTWRKATLDTAYLDFVKLMGKMGEAGAYACAYVHSETGGAFRMNLTHTGPAHVRVNAKPSGIFGGRVRVDLAKGWNRLLLKIWPGEKDWYAVPVLHAWPPATYEQKNIAWITPMPDAHGGFYGGGTGVGSLVIVGDRIYLPAEPHDLLCLRKSDGKILWIKSSSYFDAATDEEKKHPAYAEAAAIAAKLDAINASIVAGPAPGQKLEEKAKLVKELYAKMKSIDRKKYNRQEIPDIGYAGFTPVTDGKSIYVWYGTGVSVCFDLDGNRRWTRVDNQPFVEHGITSSPILVDGKMVVFSRDLIAFDAKTGKLAWQLPVVEHRGLNPGGFFHATPFPTAIGGVPVIVLGNGMIVRASDGKSVLPNPELGMQSVASPLVEGDTLVAVSAGSQLYLSQLPATFSDPLKLSVRTVSVDTAPFPTYYLPWHLSSPVVHQGLAYLLNNSGVLTVVDVARGEIVYRRMLDIDAFQWVNEGAGRGVGISPALAGRYLYFFGNAGGALVLEPGRVYKQVAKNKIESVAVLGHWAERQERFVGNPVFEGRRLYLRGEGNLYAIGAP